MSADVSEEGASRTNKVLLADVGNSRTKLALLSGVSQGMPLLERRYDLDSRDFNSDDNALFHWTIIKSAEPFKLYLQT